MAHLNRNDDFGAYRISFRMATGASGRTGKLAAGLSTYYFGSGALASLRRDTGDDDIRLALCLCTRLENRLVFHGAAPDVDGEKSVAASRNRWLSSSFRMDAFVPDWRTYPRSRSCTLFIIAMASCGVSCKSGPIDERDRAGVEPRPANPVRVFHQKTLSRRVKSPRLFSSQNPIEPDKWLTNMLNGCFTAIA